MPSAKGEYQALDGTDAEETMSRSSGSLFTLARGLLVPGNIRVLALTSMITGIYVSLLNTILQPFVVKDLGFGVAILGVLVSIGSRPSGLASSVVQPFGGALADLLGRRLLIVLGSGVGIGSMAAFLLAAATHELLALSLGYLLFGLSLLGNPASQAMIAETVAVDPGKVNVAFSVVFFFTALPGAFIPFAAGYLAASLGYVALFGMAALLESANLVIMIAKLKETRSKSSLGDSPATGFSLRRAVSIPPGFLSIFAPFAMDAFAFGIGGSIIYGMWARAFGFTTVDIGLIFGTLSVSVVASQYLATKLLIRVGTRLTLAFSEFLTVVILFGWLIAPALPVLLLLSVVFGFSVATWVPALSSLLMVSAPVEERGSIGGKLAAVRGLIATPAPIIGGLLFSVYGYYVPVLLSLVGEVITTVAILRLLPRQG
jgi:DHA1 family quinolone resistance protein-like MFS transporter